MPTSTASSRTASESQLDAASVTTRLAEGLVSAITDAGTPATTAVVDSAADEAGIDPTALRLEVMARAVRDPRIAGLPPDDAVRTILRLVHRLAPVAHVSLWRQAGGELQCLFFAGPASPPRSVCEAAARGIDSRPAGARHSLLRTLRIPGSGSAILVARPRRGGAQAVPFFLHPAARALAPVLERLAELERDAPVAEVLAGASERRLARLGFDLHDGPVQTLAALIGDTRLLTTQIGELFNGDSRTGVLTGRVEDLQARMVALEFELRCLCHSLESPAVPCRSVERVIEHEGVGFARKTGIQPVVDVRGDLTDMSSSQRIALLRVIQEALRNIAEHASARTVTVRVRASEAGVTAIVEDDGHGFDVDAAFECAVRDGRLGLIGMIERVRLLGGRCELRSSPGGPSTVSVVLPRWAPSDPA
jgi:signal transduction histidine kinase